MVANATWRFLIPLISGAEATAMTEPLRMTMKSEAQGAVQARSPLEDLGEQRPPQRSRAAISSS